MKVLSRAGMFFKRSRERLYAVMESRAEKEWNHWWSLALKIISQHSIRGEREQWTIFQSFFFVKTDQWSFMTILIIRNEGFKLNKKRRKKKVLRSKSRLEIIYSKQRISGEREREYFSFILLLFHERLNWTLVIIFRLWKAWVLECLDIKAIRENL